LEIRRTSRGRIANPTHADRGRIANPSHAERLARHVAELSLLDFPPSDSVSVEANLSAR
jgi:hypothetical protein